MFQDVVGEFGRPFELARSQRLVVVGARAVYLHTGNIELAVHEFTVDADLTIDPSLLMPRFDYSLKERMERRRSLDCRHRLASRESAVGRTGTSATASAPRIAIAATTAKPDA